MKEYDFYIVPTPIGNLGDITLRAIEVLKSVDLIACEDSRVTQKLLNHYEIKTKCISYHKYNEKERVDQIINFIKSGKKMALVSDAGTPLICDPGSVIVKELRKNNISLTSLPGANAVSTFLSQVSRQDECYSFVGFLPKSETQIKQIVTDYEDKDFIFYESPNRILHTLKLIQSVRENAQIAFGRELTKIFEEVKIDSVDNLIKHFSTNEPKGEFVVMVFRSGKNTDEIEIENKAKSLSDKGYSNKDISVILSELYGINKNKLYKILVGKQM
ncbi:MAG TPA: 16S rRNA (cytidine(1402)-2'-O)-methyltransferase [Cyanobacteria bacterium UBA11991]|nr:16S rRNA (cytidine(1402)-2'-O)-methyltransferase [Cyanobacteriota bacterium]MDY6359292.1 16S rRNA (cytidine(1402)-2'-O)-methyltransferase [Cyanobacteriota bacterium]MDY6364824.1 16S rRNA (cytidine(1402)-2'-O)-methyltransferase [Cyanobacteriota bacterium]HCB11325.1 16S rRNA (cytidine(1402)-2'-O)-methyltransferase [Cyanobacteria bacterium UBA11991]